LLKSAAGIAAPASKQRYVAGVFNRKINAATARRSFFAGAADRIVMDLAQRRSLLRPATPRRAIARKKVD